MSASGIVLVLFFTEQAPRIQVVSQCRDGHYYEMPF
jgi:hypothetical protein